MRSAAHHLFRWLLFAYPAEFRCEYGIEMGRVFAERYEEERGVRRLWFWVQTIADVISTAIQERYRIMLRDLKHSWRRLAAHPVIAATAVISLALGIGANTTIFSVVYAALLKPLPYPDVDRRVMLYTTNLNSPDRANRSLVTSLDFMDWRAQSKTLEDFHLFTNRGAATAVGGPFPERITDQLVTPGLLDSLGVRPVIGRLPTLGEGERSVVIGEAYWRRSFGGREDILGKKLIVEGRVGTIVGIVPASFELFDEPSGVDLWIPIDLSQPEWPQRRVPWLLATAKLRSGATIEQAQAEISQISAQLATAYPETNRYRGSVLVPLREAKNGWLGGLLYPLFGAVAFVLLIACTNVANLLLARAAARRRELSVRAALGAPRQRLVRELLADGIILSVPGIVAGLALAYAGLALYRATVPPIPGISNVELSTPALFFTAAAGLLAGILAAVLPALEGSRADLNEALKEGTRGSVGRARQRVRSVLVAVQIALALVLLTGAGLMINTIARLQAQSLGFDSNNVLVAQLHITGKRYMTDAPPRGIDMRYVEPPTAQLIEHVIREARAIPGVESAAIGAAVPLALSSSTGARISVLGRATPQDQRLAAYNVVSSGFFETLRIPLRRGRYIDDQDVSSALWTAVVNEAFVREYFPGGDALGQTITVVAGPDERPRQIVGVVADYKQFIVRMPAYPEIFTSYLQQTREIPGNFQGSRFRPKLIIRSPVLHTIKPEMLSEIVGRFDRDLVVFGVNTLNHFAEQRGSFDRFYASALSFFAAIALILSAVGIYALMNYSVTDRFQEIGIRVSLGASRGRVIWLISAYGFKVAIAGLLAGIAAALATTRLIERMLFGVKPWDPLTFSVVAIFLLAVAMAACMVPALRATRIDPVTALRSE